MPGLQGVQFALYRQQASTLTDDQGEAGEYARERACTKGQQQNQNQRGVPLQPQIVLQRDRGGIFEGKTQRCEEQQDAAGQVKIAHIAFYPTRAT